MGLRDALQCCRTCEVARGKAWQCAPFPARVLCDIDYATQLRPRRAPCPVAPHTASPVAPCRAPPVAQWLRPPRARYPPPVASCAGCPRRRGCPPWCAPPRQSHGTPRASPTPRRGRSHDTRRGREGEAEQVRARARAGEKAFLTLPASVVLGGGGGRRGFVDEMRLWRWWWFRGCFVACS